CRQCAEAIDKHVPPMPLVTALLPLPVNHHPGLREGESDEGADRIKWDQLVRNAVEQEENNRGKCGERVNAMREQQATAAQEKHMRQILIGGNRPGQSRKSG